MPAFPELSAADRELALLEALFVHAPVGLAYWDGTLRYRRINEALAAINGFPVAEHAGRTPGELLGPIGAEAEVALRQVLDSQVPALEQTVSGEIPPGSGEERHFVASYYPVVEAAGRVIGVAAAVLEVTAERLAEAERLRLLKEALASRAQAEAAQIRAETAQREAEAARARTELLIEAEARMSASMDYSATLEAVAAAVVAAVADWCVIALAETPRADLRSVAVAHVDPARQAQLLAARDDRELGAVLKELGVADALVVPLRTPERRIGSLTLSMSESHRQVADATGLAETIASRAALHIRNAQLYTERSHIAHTLQASLLPYALPDVPHLEVAARYQAAGDQNEVGGDFYDVYPGEDGSWWALIGDVTGKGPEAAAITSLARHTLRSGAAHDASPAANLRMLNRAMLADTSSTSFATVVCARFQPEAGRVRVALAVGGHPPPLLLHADGRLEMVDVEGTLVGALPAPSFSDVEVELEGGDLLLLYTDGVIELRTPDPGYGERRLHETVAGQAGRPVEEVLEAVLASTVDARGRRPRDDVALLGLRVCSDREA